MSAWQAYIQEHQESHSIKVDVEVTSPSLEHVYSLELKSIKNLESLRPLYEKVKENRDLVDIINLKINLMKFFCYDVRVRVHLTPK